MLYLFPYLLFFSWPVVAQALLQGHMRIVPTSINQFTRSIFVLGTLINLAMLVIHYNTIVHPFTLADNRHYVFYVFRLLMRREEIRYLAAPVYVVAGYLTIQALGAKPVSEVVASKKGKKSAQQPPALAGCSASFVLIWLITTALSLVTAPLVEPRYCILPWMMWRMHVSAAPSQEIAKDKTDEVKQGSRDSLVGPLMETVWFLAIAGVTGYMFLYRGFSWPQEPGKVQRFMW